MHEVRRDYLRDAHLKRRLLLNWIWKKYVGTKLTGFFRISADFALKIARNLLFFTTERDFDKLSNCLFLGKDSASCSSIRHIHFATHSGTPHPWLLVVRSQGLSTLQLIADIQSHVNCPEHSITNWGIRWHSLHYTSTAAAAISFTNIFTLLLLHIVSH